MAIVEIVSLPLAWREVPQRFWPGVPPIFSDGDPTPPDWALARELVAALDDTSREWYRANCPTLFP